MRLSRWLRNALWIGVCCLMLAGCSVFATRPAESSNPRAMLTQPLSRSKRQEVKKTQWWNKLFPQRETRAPESVRDFMGMKRMDP